MHSIDKHKKERGFTLIEMSFVLIIASILALTLVQFAKVYFAKTQQEIQKRVLTNATDVVSLARAFTNGAYPCPARPDLLPDDPNYGYEARDTFGGPCSITGGIRSTDGARDSSAQVLIGTVPKFILTQTGWLSASSLISGKELLKSNIQDAWNNDLTYAITEDLVVFNNNNRDAGQIKIIDEFNRDTAGTNNNAHFAIISHGANFIRRANTLSQTLCSGTDGLSTAETENCDGDSTFSIALFSQGTNYFDDSINFRMVFNNTPWIGQDADDSDITTHVRDSNQYNEDPTLDPPTDQQNQVGVFTTNPTEALDINGTLAAESYVRSGLHCGFTNDDPPQQICWNPPANFGGGLSCAATDQYMRSITLAGNGTMLANCAILSFDSLISSPADISCAGGATLAGIYSDGSPKCNN